MARLPRLTVPGLPHHVIQRGNNRQAIFLESADYQEWLNLLARYAAEHGVAVHGYVLMTNHVHLLVTPSTDTGLPRMMQSIGRSYVRHFNRTHGRTGTLWEGRYKSTVIQTERYLLTCMAYLDLNPVRAGMVAAPQDYAWSSHAHYTGLRANRWITPHALYWSLGNTPFSREVAYAEMVLAGISVTQKEALTQSALQGWALGDPDFLADIQKTTPRRLSKKRPGRPVRKTSLPPK